MRFVFPGFFIGPQECAIRVGIASAKLVRGTRCEWEMEFVLERVRGDEDHTPFAREAKKEQDFLAREFGAAFQDHRRVTGFFLPRFF
jgi:hypothetical protein